MKPGDSTGLTSVLRWKLSPPSFCRPPNFPINSELSEFLKFRIRVNHLSSEYPTKWLLRKIGTALWRFSRQASRSRGHCRRNGSNHSKSREDCTARAHLARLPPRYDAKWRTSNLDTMVSALLTCYVDRPDLWNAERKQKSQYLNNKLISTVAKPIFHIRTADRAVSLLYFLLLVRLLQTTKDQGVFNRHFNLDQTPSIVCCCFYVTSLTPSIVL